MFKIKNLVAFFALFTILLVSCKKEGELYTINGGSFPANSLTVSPGSVVLSQTTENDTAMKVSWQPASFGQNTIVAYTLQLTLPADTAGTNAWANAKNYPLGNNIFNYGFIGKDLNTLLTSLGLAAGTSNKVVLRVKADVPQYNGAASPLASIYSNAVVINVTSYNLNLYIPGEFQGWDPGTAPELRPFENNPGRYEAYVYIPGTGIKYFKYTNARDWNHTNYGDGGNKTFSTDGAAGGLSVPDGGYYQLSANLNNNTWNAIKTTWGVIGDATPGGWNNDTQMTYDVANQVWKVTLNMTANGSFKFRANNSWALNFGINNAGKIQYADHPLFPSTPGLNNLTVPSDGNYTITLDLHQSQNYTFTLKKN